MVSFLPFWCEGGLNDDDDDANVDDTGQIITISGGSSQ